MLEQVDVAAFWVVGAGFIWFLYGPWQSFWADWYKQEVFAARDSLFDLAARGEIAFSDSRYRERRRMLDMMIRYASHTTWTHLLIMIVFSIINYWSSPSFRNISRQNSEVMFEAAIRPAHKALLVMLIVRAPFIWPIFLLSCAVFFWDLAGRGMNHLHLTSLTDRLVRIERLAAGLALK